MLNAGNISVGGSSTGVPTIAVPNIAALASASNAAGAASQAAQLPAGNNAVQDMPSIVTVEVVGYGERPEDDYKRKK